jgi:LmbE family N-acetylglucosaminyl deacetylase
MNVLMVGAHFDDIELGCGGTAALHVRNGDTVSILVITNSGYTDHAQRTIRKPEVALEEGEKAADILGVTDLHCANFPTNQVELNHELFDTINMAVEEKNIETIYTHWVDDVHLDHQRVARASLSAGRHVKRVLMYRSNYYQSAENFRGNFYRDITATIEQKKEAIRAHQSEFNRVGEKWLKFFVQQNENDGMKIGVPYAECFEIVKYLEM